MPTQGEIYDDGTGLFKSLTRTLWSLSDPPHSGEGPPLFQQELLEPQANPLEFLGPILAGRRSFYIGSCATSVRNKIFWMDALQHGWGPYAAGMLHADPAVWLHTFSAFYHQTFFQVLPYPAASQAGYCM